MPDSVYTRFMSKIDYKKDYKDFYLPEATPVLVNIPAMTFLAMDLNDSPARLCYAGGAGLGYRLGAKEESGICIHPRYFWTFATIKGLVVHLGI